MTTEKTLTEQRAELELEVYNTDTDAFPGSKPWLRHNAAEKALRAFDAAHPVVAETVATERAAESEERSAQAMAAETGLTVEQVREVSASVAAKTTTERDPMNYNSTEFRQAVRALRREASEAGDAAQVRLCTIVLEGGIEGEESASEREFEAAAKECARVIAEAKAQE